jgi:hypothetical protein
MMIAGPIAIKAEEPKPWIILEPIKKWIEGENPQRAEPTVNVKKPKI